MNHVTHNSIVSMIWNIADDVLRDIYVRGKYRDVILPMTVLRRLDCLLEPTKGDVLRMAAHLEEMKIREQEEALNSASKQRFHNKSRFTFHTLLNEPTLIRANFEAYLDGFSENVQTIIDKFNCATRFLP